MKKAILYSPVQETATLFLNSTFDKFFKDNVDVLMISNPTLNLGFTTLKYNLKNLACNGNNRSPFSLLSDISLFKKCKKNDLLIFNGSTTILLSLYFKIVKPYNPNAFILHGTLKSKGAIVNGIFLTFLFFASLLGVQIYSVNIRFKRFFLRKSNFNFLGIAGVGVDEDAIAKLRPANDVKIKNSNYYTVAFIGRNEMSKGYDIFLNIASYNKDVETKFISIGSEGDVRVTNNSGIINYGAIPQELLFQKLKDIDILLLPSKSEGLGMVMVECCIAGIPTITSKTDGSLQFIKNKETGIIVTSNTVNAYLEAINEIKSNYEYYSNNCIQYSIEHNFFISKAISFKW